MMSWKDFRFVDMLNLGKTEDYLTLASNDGGWLIHIGAGVNTIQTGPVQNASPCPNSGKAVCSCSAT